MIYDPTPGYESLLKSGGWTRVTVGVDSVCSPRPLQREELAAVDWEDGRPPPLVRGLLKPRFWTRDGDTQAVIGPFEVHPYNRSPVPPEAIQAAFEATLDVLAEKLAEVRAEHGGGAFTVVFTGGGLLDLPDSFRRAMGALGITVEILGRDGSTNLVPPPD